MIFEFKNKWESCELKGKLGKTATAITTMCLNTASTILNTNPHTRVQNFTIILDVFVGSIHTITHVNSFIL